MKEVQDPTYPNIIETRNLSLDRISEITGYEVRTGTNGYKRHKRERYIDFGEGKIFESETGKILILDEKVQLLFGERLNQRRPPIDIDSTVCFIDGDTIHFVGQVKREMGTYRELYEWTSISKKKAFSRRAKYVNPGQAYKDIEDLSEEIYQAAQMATRLGKKA